MICCKNGQRLYLPAWEYNCCLVLEALEKIIKDNGGQVAEAKWIMATNRATGELEPRKMRGQTYITFTLDGYYYYFQIDDNPFFPHYYQRTEIVDGKRKRNVYIDDLPGTWEYDCLFSSCNEAEIKEIANILFNLLLTAPVSQVYHEKEVRHVPNTYDGGWHKETIYKPDEWVTVNIGKEV